MSRFFASGASSSSDSSGSSSGSSSSDESFDYNKKEGSSSENEWSESDSDAEAPKTKSSYYSRFAAAAASESDSESDDEKRVVKSHKEKRFEEMQQCLDAIAGARQLVEVPWSLILTEFEKLNKSYAKVASSLPQVPLFYVRGLVALEDSVNLASQDKNKKMNAIHARALNALKQKLKKMSGMYQKEMEQCRLQPEGETSAVAVGGSPVLVGEESSWSEADSEESSSSSDGEERTGVDKWRKREPTKKKEEKPQQPQKKTVTVVAPATTAPATATSAPSAATPVAAIPVFTVDNVLPELRKIYAARGKKNTDKLLSVTYLEGMLKVPQLNVILQVKVRVALMAALFDLHSTSAYLPAETWMKAYHVLNHLLDTLMTHEWIQVAEDADDDDGVAEITSIAVASQQGVKIRGSLSAYAQRLDDEWLKALTQLEPHSEEFVQRLTEEMKVYQLLVKMQRYVERKQSNSTLEWLLRRVEHLYYKPMGVMTLFEQNLSSEPFIKLCLVLLQNEASTARQRVRALICLVYHYAMQRGNEKSYYLARDYWQMLQSMIVGNVGSTVAAAGNVSSTASTNATVASMTVGQPHQPDLNTCILLNRCLAQLGCAAFDQGLFREAFNSLHDLMSHPRYLELLGQAGNSLIPYQCHLNVEWIENVYWMSSILLEIPLMNHSKWDHRPSKPLKRLLEAYERQWWSSITEISLGLTNNAVSNNNSSNSVQSSRDALVLAAKYLAAGEWKSCLEKFKYVIGSHQTLSAPLINKIKMESCRAYLLDTASHYSSISLSQLAVMFDLEVSQITHCLQKMILSEELKAHLDPSHETLILGGIVVGASQSSFIQSCLTLVERKWNQCEELERWSESLMNRRLPRSAPTGNVTSNTVATANEEKPEKVTVSSSSAPRRKGRGGGYSAAYRMHATR